VSGTTVAYIWARGVRSPDPAWNCTVPLVKSWSLSKKSGRDQVWIEPIIDHSNQTISYRIIVGGSPPPGTVNRGNGVCVASGSSIPASYIKAEGSAGRLVDVPLAMVVDSIRGREFREFDGTLVDHLAAEWEPTGAMSDHSQYMGTPRYGLDEWRKLFSKRQLVALTTFSDLISSIHDEIRLLAIDRGDDPRRLSEGGSGAVAYADALVTYLAFVFDKCLNSWSSLATWSDSGFVRPVFARQAISMTWDFAEVNPFSDATGNWNGMTDWVVRAVKNLPFNNFGTTSQRDAQARIEEVGNCVVSTDPPYYDNVPYADLSDYFYVWMRKNLSSIWPDEFATLLTPKAEELVANHVRAGSWEAAQKHFQQGMFKVFETARRLADERYPTTIFYAFKAAETTNDQTASTGWEVFLSGLLDAGYSVVATWPIRTEKPGRTREIGAAALSSSVVLVCRGRSISAAMATRGEFITALRAEMAPAIRILQVENIAPVDMAQSAIGPGIGIFSRYSKVVEADGQAMTVRTALSLINEVLSEVLSGEESEFDADTRFAVTWFEQYGHNPGVFGDADTLAKAKNTTVSGVVDSGIASSKEGKLRLLERGEMLDDWDPNKDSRLTVWEATQHLIRALEVSESDAAELLKKIGGGFGDKARQLAYLLYGICDRKRWAGEGGAYNMLIAAWPEIEKLARQEPTGDSSPETLF
jgi:putative DNA methylase